MKKAQGISINVIIIAAIALLVLVILAVLVLNGGVNLKEETQSCGVMGGVCTDNFCDQGVEELAGLGEAGCGDDQVCCKIFN